jgi:hypothetical protein
MRKRLRHQSGTLKWTTRALQASYQQNGLQPNYMLNRCLQKSCKPVGIGRSIRMSLQSWGMSLCLVGSARVNKIGLECTIWGASVL